MVQEYNINGMVSKIKGLRRNAAALKEIGGDIPAVVKNADRILACVKMLEMDISAAAGLTRKQS